MKEAVTKNPNTVQFHLHEGFRIVEFLETESKRVVATGCGEAEVGSSCLMGQEFQFAKMKKLW